MSDGFGPSGRHQVLVGVETADCLPLLRAAVDEARRRRCRLHLLHVLPPVYAAHPHIEELSAIAGELHARGAAVLGSATETLASLADDVVVTTELCHGTPPSALLESSAHSCLVVLQHEQAPGRPRLLSVTRYLAARAHCPVLAVPAAWRASAGSGPSAHAVRAGRPVVVAGVIDAVQSAGVVRAALDEAYRRHARLVLVHGLTGSELAGSAEPLDQAWVRTLQRELEADLADLCSRRHDVAVELRMVAGPAGQAIAAQAAEADADVVVVGRGQRRLPFPARPGPVADEVLHHAQAPVLVVDDAPATPLSRPWSRRRDLADVAVP